VHKQKLIHRDIKPSNIMVSLEEGDAVTVKIIDLGLAKRSMNQVLKPRFQHLGLSLEHRSSPVRSNSLESVHTYVQICIHLVSRSGRW
jgi:serine/threonine protein kinase